LYYQNTLRENDTVVVYSVYGTEIIHKKEKNLIRASVINSKNITDTIFTEHYLTQIYTAALDFYYKEKNTNIISFTYDEVPMSGKYSFETSETLIKLTKIPDIITSYAKLKINYEVFYTNFTLK
jgi:ssRNA-specific RNase YbeY (16S rRNA maturation enzyme)